MAETPTDDPSRAEPGTDLLALPDELVPGIEAVGAAIAVTVVSLEGSLLYVSPGFGELLGRSREELVGSHWSDFVDEAELPAIEEAIADTTRAPGAPPLRIEWRLARALGTSAVWLESRVTPLWRGPERIGWVVAALDVSDRKEAELAVARNEAHLRKIVDSGDAVITVLGEDGSFQWSSEDHVLGYGPSETPAHVFDIIHLDDRDQVMATFGQLLDRRGQDRTPRLGQYRALAADGTWRWIETQAVNLLDDEDVGGIVVHSRDVTLRHQAVEELHKATSRLTTLISHLNLGVVMVDEDGNCAVVNQAFAVACGMRDPADLVGQPDGYFPQEARARISTLVGDVDRHMDRRREIARARRPVFDEPVELKDRTWGRTFIPITVDGRPSGHLWLLRDMSEELAAEAERERLLDIQMRQNRRLREVDAAKSELVAAISHELRTPLSSVMSFVQLLSEGLGEDGEEEQREYLEVVARNTQRLLRSVDDLLMIDRIESQPLSFQLVPVDVPALVELAVASITPSAEHKGVALECRSAPGPQLRGDPDRLGQMVDNLLTNAVKFTPGGGRVEVSALPTAECWELTVSDTGIGIPAGERAELFGRFFRATNARRAAIDGSGLGLTITRGVVLLHHGTIEVESSEGAGTRFVIRLPVDDGIS